MKIFSSLSPKRFFGSKKSRYHVSRSSSSSSSSAAGTPTTVLPEASGEFWSAQANFELLDRSDPKDKDRAGLLVSIDELGELMARLGAEPPSREEVAAVLGGLGRDGRVSVDALVSRVGSVCGPAGDVELRETFDFFDADRDGRITEAELLGAMRALGGGRCSLEECRRMIAAADENGDGFVCFADFARMMELHG